MTSPQTCVHGSSRAPTPTGINRMFVRCNTAAPTRRFVSRHTVAKRTTQEPSPAGEGGPHLRWMRCHTSAYISLSDLMMFYTSSVGLRRHSMFCLQNSTVLAHALPLEKALNESHRSVCRRAVTADVCSREEQAPPLPIIP